MSVPLPKNPRAQSGRHYDQSHAGADSHGTRTQQKAHTHDNERRAGREKSGTWMPLHAHGRVLNLANFISGPATPAFLEDTVWADDDQHAKTFGTRLWIPNWNLIPTVFFPGAFGVPSLSGSVACEMRLLDAAATELLLMTCDITYSTDGDGWTAVSTLTDWTIGPERPKEFNAVKFNVSNVADVNIDLRLYAFDAIIPRWVCNP